MDSLVFEPWKPPRLESRDLPQDEAEREFAVLDGFLGSAAAGIGLPFQVTGRPQKLPERDLDFVVPTSDGERLFELAGSRPETRKRNPLKRLEVRR